MTSLRMTTADLDVLPDPIDGTRYEIIDGELYVAKQPSLAHQFAADAVCAGLRSWSTSTGRGFAFSAPGVIFAEDDSVAPDVVWISRERLREATGDDGKLHDAPELIVETISPGAHNEQRDRDFKRKLYSRQRVAEYWIVDCQAQEVAVHLREQDELRIAATLGAADSLEPALLPGFILPIEELFFPDTAGEL